MTNGQKFIECPRCQSGVGFYAPEPNICPFACLILKEAQKKPAANESWNASVSCNDGTASCNDPEVFQDLEAAHSQTETNSPVNPVARLPTAADEEPNSKTARICSDNAEEFDIPKVTQSQSDDTDDDAPNKTGIEEASTSLVTPPKPSRKEANTQSACPRRSNKRKPVQPTDSLKDSDTSESDEGPIVVTPPPKKMRRAGDSDGAQREQPVKGAHCGRKQKD